MTASWQLRGTSYERAKCYGAPNWDARYTSGTGYRLSPGARCMVCGRPAANAHHEPPKGMGGVREWELLTPKGPRLLRPALIALCGSGTTGCHGARHRGDVSFRWVWDTEEAEAAWWDGEIGMTRNESALYRLGFWEVEAWGEVVERRQG